MVCVGGGGNKKKNIRFRPTYVVFARETRVLDALSFSRRMGLLAHPHPRVYICAPPERTHTHTNDITTRTCMIGCTRSERESKKKQLRTRATERCVSEIGCVLTGLDCDFGVLITHDDLHRLRNDLCRSYDDRPMSPICVQKETAPVL